MKTNYGLVNYCKDQLGLPYWWGTFGQVATRSLYEQKKKQYPNQYKADDFKCQYGLRVHDCVGLIKGYLLSNDKGQLSFNENTFRKYDKDVSGMLANCSEVGDIKNIPDIPGVLVFMKGHVGVYIGNGKVIEAKGHAYGVVKTDLRKRGWEKYGKLKWITYSKKPYNEEMKKMIDKLINDYGEVKVENALRRLIETYIDDGEPSPWAIKEVEDAKKMGITDGSNPQMFATRQEVMMMTYRGVNIAVEKSKENQEVKDERE